MEIFSKISFLWLKTKRSVKVILNCFSLWTIIVNFVQHKNVVNFDISIYPRQSRTDESLAISTYFSKWIFRVNKPVRIKEPQAFQYSTIIQDRPLLDLACLKRGKIRHHLIYGCAHLKVWKLWNNSNTEAATQIGTQRNVRPSPQKYYWKNIHDLAHQSEQK